MVVTLPKPPAIFDREYEWDDLCRFVADGSPGLRLGVVRGRRRHGKSFLLEHLCRAMDGVCTLALRQSRAMALARFADGVSRAVGYRLGRFDDWPAALDTVIDTLSGARRERPVLIVIDEFPYLAAGSPELPSAIQALYDQRGPATGHPAVRVILCGSAISVMSTLLAGDQALRGRAALDLRVGAFRFRDAAAYWQCAPETALLVDSVLGGAPGYRDLIGAAPQAGASGFSHGWNVACSTRRTRCSPNRTTCSPRIHGSATGLSTIRSGRRCPMARPRPHRSAGWSAW